MRETLRRIDSSLGRKMVEVEGDTQVGVRRALSLWSEHLALKLFRMGYSSESETVGTGVRRPVVYS